MACEEWADFCQGVELALMLHFGEVQDMVLTEHNRSHLLNRLTESQRFLNRHESELMEVLKRRVLTSVELLEVHLALELLEEVGSETALLLRTALNRDVCFIGCKDLVELTLCDYNGFEEH